ncbi:hypothetical protein H6770_02125 [Candidatus Peribacteria bacterium]|nr:hypothetical protein [Candidatus Peribacteria bacterium]
MRHFYWIVDTAYAYTSPQVNVSGLFAGGLTWSKAINNIIQTLGVTIFYVSTAAFMIGALMYTAGFINEENKSKGKQLMIGALLGMGVVLSAKAIFNAAYFFVYGV